MDDARTACALDDVHGFLQRICFKTGPPGRIGAELEWLVVRRDRPEVVVPLEEVRSLVEGAGTFPGGSAITLEPGGQVELSSAPAADVVTCHVALQRDMEHLGELIEPAGLSLVASAIDPYRPAVRQLRQQRYDAMAAYFDTLPHRLGPIMMSSTAAIQVNVEAGQDAADVVRRWKLLHLLGPTLSATFANSPRRHGRPTGWKSTRQAVWLHLDPRRTLPPQPGDPAAAWTSYVLAAPVMMTRTGSGAWHPSPGFTFGEWAAGEVPAAGRPTYDDLDYHLTTLFPPVRPRGWFEVRYLDQQSPQWWPVPVVVLATLLDRPELQVVVEEACAATSDAWVEAARAGLDDDRFARAARKLFRAVAETLTDGDLRDLLLGFMERYVERCRCPADDDLVDWRPQARNGRRHDSLTTTIPIDAVEKEPR